MTIELEFSRKYDRMHAAEYLRKHRTGLARRLSHWREESIARKALKLAGDPASVLDLLCGAGRFWPLLAERADRTILAADNSVDMRATARAVQPANVVARIDAFQTSAFGIGLETGFQIAAALDFLPGYAMWRTYVLRKPVSRTCAT
jgi:SAM-dependent methyltransferase